MGAGDEETIKQKILSTIFDQNPVLQSISSMYGNIPTKIRPFSENKWYQFYRSMELDTTIPEINDIDPFHREDKQWKHIHLQYRSSFPDFLGVNDMTMAVSSTTTNGCTPLELNAFECLEYYGLKRGTVICRDYYDDWMECNHQHKQFARNLMMKSKRNQRWLEYLAGKREWNTVYLANGPPGVYLDPCPNPRDKIMFDPPA